MRRAILFERTWDSGLHRYVNTKVGEVVFHCFGVEYEELPEGPGNYSVAIIEHPDGRLEGVPVSKVQFCIPSEAKSDDS